MYYKKIKFLLALVFVFNYSFGQSDSINILHLSLEELLDVKVITSSKKGEKIEDAPNIIYVITKDQIQKRGLKSFYDIIHFIPGLDAFQGDFGYFTQVRGIAPNAHNKVSFMINGQIVNPLVETNFLTGPINFDNAERIEVIVGPGSVLYGAETLLAIVNIITLDDPGNVLTLRFGQGLDSKADIMGYKNVNASLSKKWDDSKYINISFSGLTSEGWVALDTINIKNQAYHDIHNRKLTDSYSPSYYFNANARVDNLKFQYVSYNAEMIDIGWTQPHNSEGVRIDYIDDFQFQADKKLSELSTIFLKGNYTNKRTARMTTEGVNTNVDLAQTNYTFESGFQFKPEKHYLQAGIKFVNYQNRFNYNMLWAPEDPVLSGDTSYVRQFIDRINYNSYGFYLSEEWNASRNLKMVLASRIDFNEMLKENKPYFSPRVAIIYNPTKKITTKFLLNTSTHMPTPRQSPLNLLYGSDKPEGIAPVWAASNHNVNKPEQLVTYEIQSVFNFTNYWTTFNVYYQELNDFISWFNPATNVGDFTGYGCEFDLKSKFKGKVNFWINGSFTKTDFVLNANKFKESSNVPSNDDGEVLAVPALTSSAGIDVDLVKDLSLSLIGRYFTKQPARFVEYDANAENFRKEEWGYVNNKFYLDVNLLYKNVLVENLNAQLKVNNLTNNTDLIAAQYREYRYSPRGAWLYFTLAYMF